MYFYAVTLYFAATAICCLQQVQRNLQQAQRKLVVLCCKQMYFYVVILHFATHAVCYLQQIQQNLKQIQRKLVDLCLADSFLRYFKFCSKYSLSFEANAVSCCCQRSPVVFLALGKEHVLSGAVVARLEEWQQCQTLRLMEVCQFFQKQFQSSCSLKELSEHFEKFLMSFHQCSIRVPIPCLYIKRFSLSDIDYFHVCCCFMFICLDLPHRFFFLNKTYFNSNHHGAEISVI